MKIGNKLNSFFSAWIKKNPLQRQRTAAGRDKSICSMVESLESRVAPAGIVGSVFIGGSIGAITVNGGGISGSTFVGSVASITTTGTIADTVVHGATIGDITAAKIMNSTFAATSTTATAALQIGNVTVSGDVTGSHFLGGYKLGANLKFDGTGGGTDDSVTGAAKIGNIDIGGTLHSTNIVAGGGTGTDNVFGNEDAAEKTAAGSSIGKIKVGAPAAAPDGTANYAIQAAAIASQTATPNQIIVAGATVTLPVKIGVGGNSVRVRIN